MFSSLQASYLHGSEVLIIQCMMLASIATLTDFSSLRIIGGRDVKQDELPYVVRLEYEIKYIKNNISKAWYVCFCTGSTLSPQWTLTAGHCLTEEDDPAFLNYMRVVGYGTPTGIAEGSKRSYFLEEFTRYEEQYGKLKDIALIRTEPITLEKYGKLSALDYASLLYQEVTIAGYGLTNYSDVRLYSAYDLRKPLQVMKAMLVSCYKKDVFKTVGYLCVNAKCSGPATPCPGDSGSPYIHNTGIIGVDSRGPVDSNCQLVSDFFRTPELGFVFVVSPYVDWINHVVNSDTNLTSEG